MAEEKDNDFLTNIIKDGQELNSDEEFLNTLDEPNEEEKDTPADSSTEDNQNDNEPSQEGGDKSEAKDDKKDDKKDKADDENTLDEKPEPFHKHPRWKKMQDENKDLRSELDDMNTTVDEIKDSQQPQGQTQLPDWWIKLAGSDDVSRSAYEGFTQQTKVTRDELREELIAEQEANLEEQQSEKQYWDSWVEEEVQTLKDSGKVFDKNELIKIAMEYQPTDDEGGISLTKAYDILSLKKLEKDGKGKDKSDARKKIASDTTSDGQGEQTPSNTIDPQELRGKSFSALVQEK